MVACPICNKNLKQMHGSHIIKHNMTSEEFKLKYPNISFRNENSYKKQRIKAEENTLNDNIRCLNCRSLITGKYRKHRKFCNSSCSATYSNFRKVRNKKECLFCKTIYETSCNHSKYCSNSCSSLSKTKEKIELVCDNCSSSFLKKKAIADKSIKHFCTNDCKREFYVKNSQERGIFHTHNGKSSISTYRKLAFKIYDAKCYYCGYCKHLDVLQVHHMDENRNNNSIENLRIVCPTCHSEIHRKHK